MTFQKFLVVASKQDAAGSNITTRLSQFRANPLLSGMKKEANFDFHLVEESILQTENLDMEKINRYDFIIFASRHSSESKEKTLSIHAPGNWRNAEHGGESGKVCPASALFQKQMFENLIKMTKEHQLDEEYKVTMEVTHHGPLIKKPCLFIEVGSTMEEWNDRRAGFVLAKTIDETIKNYKENPYNEVAIAIGGPHYCPSFNKIQESSNVAISHVIPKYKFPLTKEMVQEALDKTTEDVDLILLDWKGLGNKEIKEQTLSVLKDFYIQVKRTGEISK
jgi:D-aminoacyl-tRNA deacylase